MWWVTHERRMPSIAQGREPASTASWKLPQLEYRVEVIDQVPKMPRMSEVRSWKARVGSWTIRFLIISGSDIPQLVELCRPAGNPTLVKQPMPMGHSQRHKKKNEPLYLDRRGHPKKHCVGFTKPRVRGQNSNTKEQSDTMFPDCGRFVGAYTERKR